MSAKPKLADPEATKARLNEGRQWIGIKNLEAPDEVQPRASIDKDWVSQLVTFRREGSEFPPARVYQLPDARLILAEGHHRRWALLGDNEADMLCDVVDGTMEEAIVHASGSNKSNGVKPMSAKDIKKATWMLFRADNSWLHKPAKSIAAHIGNSYVTAAKHRLEYAAEHHIKIEEIETTRGFVPVEKCSVRSRMRKVGEDGHVSYRGKQYHVGREHANERIDVVNLLNGSAVHGRWQLSGDAIRNRLLKIGIHARLSLNKSSSMLGTCVIIDHVAAISRFVRTRNSKDSYKFASACWFALANREVHCPKGRAIIVGYEMPNGKSADVARSYGIELMEPDELIKSLGPCDPSQ